MASNYWAKIWIETLDDPKVARLPDSSWRRFFECVLLAKELDAGGVLPAVPDMSWRLRLSDTTMSDDLHRLALAGLVELREYDGEERWFISNFQKRQDGMTNAERQKRYRDSHTSGGRNGIRITNSVTNGYTNPVTQRNAETETEKDTDTEGEGEAASAARTPARAHYGQFDRTPGANGKGYKLAAEPPVSPPASTSDGARLSPSL